MRIKGSRSPVRLILSWIKANRGTLSALVQRRNICHVADARTSSFLRPPAQLELTPRKTLSLAVLITPPNVACVRACPRVWIMCACLPACSRRRPYRRRRTNSWHDRLRTCRVYMTTDDSSPSFFFNNPSLFSLGSILYRDSISIFEDLITMSLRGFEIEETHNVSDAGHLKA